MVYVKKLLIQGHSSLCYIHIASNCLMMTLWGFELLANYFVFILVYDLFLFICFSFKRLNTACGYMSKNTKIFSSYLLPFLPWVFWEISIEVLFPFLTWWLLFVVAVAMFAGYYWQTCYISFSYFVHWGYLFDSIISSLCTGVWHCFCCQCLGVLSKDSFFKTMS